MRRWVLRNGNYLKELCAIRNRESEGIVVTQLVISVTLFMNEFLAEENNYYEMYYCS